MKTNAVLKSYLERHERNGSAAMIHPSDAPIILSDLAELQRLESEPRAGWEVIGSEQRGGAFWIVGHKRGPSVMARYTHRLAWTVNNTQSMLDQPTHYLANIPPVPEPAIAPTADEWSAMVRAYVEEWREQGNSARHDDSTFGKLIELMERHNAASK